MLSIVLGLANIAWYNYWIKKNGGVFVYTHFNVISHLMLLGAFLISLNFLGK